MIKPLIPIVIVLGTLLYSLFWCNFRKPQCNSTSGAVGVISEVDSAKVDTLKIDTTTLNLTPTEKALFQPLVVYFQSGSANIIRTEEVNKWLTLAKNYLAENPNEQLSLTGHTDSEGSDELNDELSVTRAQKVKDILIKEGFKGENLLTSGKGEREPIADNATEEGRSKNRRVSIRLIK